MPSQRPLRWHVVVVAGALIAGACSSAGSHAASPTTTRPSTSSVPGSAAPVSTATTAPVPLTLPPVQPVAWAPCDGTDGPTGYDCATVSVPLNYSDPGGTKIGIAIDRKAASGAKIGSLLMNPGGPGASGVDFLDDLVAFLPPTILEHFDVVSFDPRGVARSAPIRCETGPQLDQLLHLNPAPTTASGLQQLLAADKAFTAGCEARSGSLLPYVGSVNVARDMDEIRSAVGDAKLTYIGFSYGTFLGDTYASLFPTHIRAMVLDGVVDPALGPISTDIEQAAGFEKELTAFFNYCTGNTLCPWQPAGSLRADYGALMAQIAAHPLPAGGGRTLGAGEAFLGVVEELYDPSLWAPLATGLAKADAGDGSLVLQYSDDYSGRMDGGAYTNSFEASNAVSCVDQPWPRDPAVVEQAAVSAQKQAPDFGVADLYGGLACTDWPAPATSQPHAIDAAGSPPIVVVGSTGDPATPYANAQAVAKELQHGVLLTRVGDGHTGYVMSACVRSYVDSYLVNLTVPPAGTSCPTP